MKKLVRVGLAVLLTTWSFGMLFSDDHNSDIGPNGNEGVPSAWDQENVNVLDGNVHLTIPLYSVFSGQDFGMSAALEYDSKVWDAADLNSGLSGVAPNRNLIAKSVFGLGWKMHFARVFSLTYTTTSGGVTTSQTFYYFQGMDGGLHRLFLKNHLILCNLRTAPEPERTAANRLGAAPYRVVGASACSTNPEAPGCGGDNTRCCVSLPYWYTFDGSGIQATSSATGWTVWLADGTKYLLTHEVSNDLNTPEQVNYKGWYVTTIESAVRTGTAAGSPPVHTVTFEYVDPAVDNSRRYCPVRMYDDLGRTVSFQCVSSVGGVTIDGGLVTGVTVPAPPDPVTLQARTLTYALSYTVETVTDPLGCNAAGCDSKPLILLLQSIAPQGVVPAQSFQFGYQNGELTSATLPGGARRAYTYGTYQIWRKDFPNIYNSTSGQFAYFPVRGVISRQLQIDGKTWQWDYTRVNDPNCGLGFTSFCYNHPIKCTVAGPYDPSNSGIQASTTVYNYNATSASSSTPSPFDGTISSIKTWAGPENTGVLLRTMAFEYGGDAPQGGMCSPNAYYIDHYVDNLRTTKTTITFEDDGKASHDQEVVENSDWMTLNSQNIGVFQTTTESQVLQGVKSPYRITKRSYSLVQNPDGMSVPTVTWVRLIKGDGVTPVSETDYTYTAFGQPQTMRRLYNPGSSAQMQDPNDLLTTFNYDASGNLSQKIDQVAGQTAKFTEIVEWQNGYPMRRHFDGTDIGLWYSLNVVRDLSTGLPLQSSEPWGMGVSVGYDLLGRPLSIAPLTGSGSPPVAAQYAAGQESVQVGDPASQTSVQWQTLFDGLGRTKEERRLKYDDQGFDQWVCQTFSRDVLGNAVTTSEWAPLTGSPLACPTGAPITSLERFGSYGAVQAYDPLARVRRILGPDGSTTTKTYQGLVTTTTVQGVQGGAPGTPNIDSVTTTTEDIYGRIVKVAPAADGAVVDTGYDEGDRVLQSTSTDTARSLVQVRSSTYDHLGRLLMSSDPERGKVWYGTHVVVNGADVVNPNGYNALGAVALQQNAAGWAANPPYHLVVSYDSAGRVTSLVRETEEQSPQRTTIADYAYDLQDHGNGAGSHLGRLARDRGNDKDGNLVAQTDYYYQDGYGRMNQATTVFGGWGTAYTISYQYDNLGLVSSINYPATGSVIPTVLLMGRIHGFVLQIGSNRGYQILTSALYNEAGILKQWLAGNNVKTVIDPDPSMLARPREIKVINSSGTQLWTSGVYSYAKGGSVAGIGSDLFTYDSRGRLSTSQVAGTAANTTYSNTYTYDAFDNLTATTESVNFGLPSGTTYHIDPTTNRILGLGQASNWQYREDGALTNDDAFNYQYDSVGRLIQIQAAGTEVGTYGYNARGERVYRKEDHGKEVFYFRDPSGNILSQFSRPAGTTLTRQWDRDFVYFEGRQVGMIEESAPAAISWKNSSATGTSVSLEWYASTSPNIYGYLVYRMGPGQSDFTPLFSGSLAVSTTSTTYTDTSVTGGQNYVYRVVGVDVAGNRGTASADRPITPGDTTPPDAPSGLTATPGNNIVSLTWNQLSSPPDMAGYFVYRRTGPSYGASLNSVPLAVLLRSYDDLSVFNGTTYYYVVKAVDTAGNLSAPSNEVSATPKSARRSSLKMTRPLSASQMMAWIPSDTAGRSADGALAPYESIGQGTGASNAYFLHTDHLGSLRLVTDIYQQVIAVHKYQPYGKEVQAQASSDPLLFAGYETDTESSMKYAMARYYSPDKGRWLTPDLLGSGYGYVAGNPVTLVDPSGLDHRIGGGGGGIVCSLTIATVCTHDSPTPPPSAKSGSGPCTSEAHYECFVFSHFRGGTSIDQTPPQGGGGPGGGAGGGDKTKNGHKICSALPEGRTMGVSYAIGGLGSAGGTAEVVINYNTGAASVFTSGGVQVGWNGLASGSLFMGLIWGLGSSNTNFSGGFTSISGGAGLGGYMSSSSGGLTGGGLAPNGNVTVAGISYGGSLLGPTGVASATNYSQPLSLGKYAPLFNPFDLALYVARQICN